MPNEHRPAHNTGVHSSDTDFKEMSMYRYTYGMGEDHTTDM